MNGDIDTVLFDLDGTLLDTAGDLAGALNAVLRRHGHEPLDMGILRAHVSKGAMALICLGFNLDPDCKQAGQLFRELLEFYRHNLSANTCLFAGMESILDLIEDSGRNWGIVTNKPGYLTDPLLRDMALSNRTACVVSGDTLAKRKPWPDPLLHACDLIGTTVARSIYIGDDERDIESGRRAGMRTIAAAYGYIVPGDDPANWGADAMINHPDEIRQWLE